MRAPSDSDPFAAQKMGPSFDQTLLKVSRSWVYEHTRSRGTARAERLPYIKGGKYKRFDPRSVREFLVRRSTRLMTSWRCAWRSLRAYVGLVDLRSRRARSTGLGDSGPDGTCVARDDETYSHIRRTALDEAAAVLEPGDIESWETTATEQAPPVSADPVTSHPTSQSDESDAGFREILKEGGSPHWTISATG
jgi:hypothetical protein